MVSSLSILISRWNVPQSSCHFCRCIDSVSRAEGRPRKCQHTYSSAMSLVQLHMQLAAEVLSWPGGRVRCGSGDEKKIRRRRPLASSANSAIRCRTVNLIFGGQAASSSALYRCQETPVVISVRPVIRRGMNGCQLRQIVFSREYTRRLWEVVSFLARCAREHERLSGRWR